MDALTLLSYGLVGFLVAPVAVFVLVFLHKEVHHEQPLRGLLWFGVAMIALCVIAILFFTLHRASTLHKPADRFEIYHHAR
jgi:drug/metabolite transporter (DMT)-like permease